MSEQIKLEQYSDSENNNSLLLILPGHNLNLDALREISKTLQANFKVLLYLGDLPKPTEVYEFAKNFCDNLINLGHKRFTIFAESAACALAQALTLHSNSTGTGAVRRLLLLDPQSRIKPNLLNKILDKIESKLPLGLPLRPLNEDFDSRSSLHRLRCPVTIALSQESNLFLRHEASLLHKRIPNCYYVEFSHSLHTNQGKQDLLHELNKLLQKSVKNPQKNLARRNIQLEKQSL
jgi:hypothetical protein